MEITPILDMYQMLEHYLPGGLVGKVGYNTLQQWLLSELGLTSVRWVFFQDEVPWRRDLVLRINKNM